MARTRVPPKGRRDGVPIPLVMLVAAIVWGVVSSPASRGDLALKPLEISQDAYGVCYVLDNNIKCDQPTEHQ